MKTKSTLFCVVFAFCTNLCVSVYAQAVNVKDSLALVDLYNSTDGPNWSNHANWLNSPVSTWYGIIVTGTMVTAINLYVNQLTGNIPSSLGNLQNLQTLYLYGNQLSGQIPSSLGDLQNLQDLNLTSNQLTGNIPSSLGDLQNLLELNLAANRLTGSIPSSLGNLKNLDGLVLSYNPLQGSIPSSLGDLQNLQALYLSANQLTGNIPSSLGNLVNLYTLELSGNRLSGVIPSSLGELANLHFLNLVSNHLTGNIPSSFGDLSHLSYLVLEYNRFTFDGMELIAEMFPFADYDTQKDINIHQRGNTLSVSAGGTLSNNTYNWCKVVNKKLVHIVTIKGDSVFHPTESGDYMVSVTNKIAKQLTLYSKPITYLPPNNSIVSSSENALQELNKTNFFSVYPNPAKNILHVQTNSAASFSLINQSGKISLTTTINGKGSINVSSLAPGIYYLRNNTNKTVQKVAISR